MKKCVCISCFDYYSTRMESLIGFLEKEGFEITYFYADYDHFTKRKNENTYKYGKSIKVMEYKKNLSFQRLYSHYEFSKKIGKQIRIIKPDFIYCVIPPNYLLRELSGYKKKKPNTKLVYDVYDLWPQSFPYSKKSKLLSIPFSFWGKLRSKNIAVSDLILCVSEQGRTLVLPEANNTPVKILKPVIAAGEMPEYVPSTDKLSFCYLGMVNHITDMDLGEKLLSRLAEIKPTVLHIIGEGQNLDEFVQRLKRRNVDVICHGCIFDRAKKNDIFSKCNMGLNIPRDEIDSTMSLKAVEYICAGLPFINNAKGDIRKIVQEDNVGINYENNIEQIVDKIISMEDKAYNEMHENCISAYESRFLAQDYADVFDGLLGKNI